MAAVLLSWVALVFVQLIFAIYGVILGNFSSNSEDDPLVFCLYRTIGTSFVLLMVTRVAEKSIIIPPLRDIHLFAALAFVKVFGGQLFHILGIFYAGPVVASVFMPAIAVWTTLLAIVMKVEPVPLLRKVRGWAKVLGILLAVGGAVMMVVLTLDDKAIPQDRKSTGGQFLGSLFSLGNTLVTAIHLLLQKKFIFEQPKSIWRSRPVGVTTWTYCFGVIFLGFASLYNVNKPEKFTSVAQEQVCSLLFAIFINSVLAQLLLTWCNKQISSSLVSATFPLQTLFSAILSYIFLGDVIQLEEYAGATLIILGMMAVVWSNYADKSDLQQVGDQFEQPGETTAAANGYVQIPSSGPDPGEN